MSQPQPELLLVLISSQVPKAPSEKAETGVTNKDVQLSLGPLSQAVSESQTSIFTCLRGPLFPNANPLGHFAVETVCSWDHRRGPLRPGPAFLYLGWWISDYLWNPMSLGELKDGCRMTPPVAATPHRVTLTHSRPSGLASSSTRYLLRVRGWAGGEGLWQSPTTTASTRQPRFQTCRWSSCRPPPPPKQRP
jgi:hypothetical protein